MQILNELNENFGMALALGYFDGVHKGHQKVIKSAVNYAKDRGVKSAVITFKEHPCCYLWNVCPKYILTRKMRQEKIEELGVDYLYELDFEKICKLNANEYLKDIIVKYFRPVSISAGWNHNFGCKKSGNGEVLRQNSEIYGYKFFEIEPEKFNNYVVSSTHIRGLLADGKIEDVNGMLGYKFSIKGEVIKGRQIGRKIGFRTANIKYPPELINLPYGAYSAETVVQGNIFKSVANFGVRPTLGGCSDALLEVHLLGFDKDIYGENIEIKFNKIIRTEKKFNSLDELKTRINKDISLM